MSNALLRLYVSAIALVQDRYDGRKDRGATAVEYGLLAGLMALAVVAAVAILGPKLSTLFGAIQTTFQ